jgi:hypothetical protein
MNSAARAKRLDDHQIPLTCTLLAADVKSLYPSIDIDRGLDALNDALKQSGKHDQTRQLIILLTRWVLLNNITEFIGKLYIRIRGFAMRQHALLYLHAFIWVK